MKICDLCHRQLDPAKSAHAADYHANPNGYCPQCWRPLERIITVEAIKEGK